MVVRRESIACASNCLYVVLYAEFSQRLAQSAHVNVNRPLLNVNIRAPDPVKQLISTIDAVGMCHEVLQQPILSWAQVNFLAANGDSVCGRINDNIADFGRVTIGRP